MVTFLTAILVLSFNNTGFATRISIGIGSLIMCIILIVYLCYTWEIKHGVSHQWFNKIKFSAQKIPHDLWPVSDTASTSGTTVVEHESVAGGYGVAAEEDGSHGVYPMSNVAAPQ